MTRRPKKIVLNADDFGGSEESNEAIIQGFREGLVSTTTIMPAGEAFEDACEKVEQEILSGRIGLHISLTEGKARADEAKQHPLLCNDKGDFLFQHRNGFRLSPDLRHAIRAELEAQYQACEAASIHPTHLDSHQHVHLAWGVLGEFIRLARRKNIPVLRLHRNVTPHVRLFNRIYFALVNLRIRIAGLAGVDRFASVEEAPLALSRTGESVELMLHPFRRADGVLTNYNEHGVEIRPLLDRLNLTGKGTTFQPSPV